jgi:ethanolamine utilization protein EutQ
MDVRLKDVVTGEHGMPIAAGIMSLRKGTFPWTLDYDEVEYVVEGELHIVCGDREVIGRPGDVIAVPKGSSITFGTPSWAKFLYVTYPADWGGGS